MKKFADVLIVIDLQNGVCTGVGNLYNLDDLLIKVNKRISLYRELDKPVIFVQHCDDELVPEEDPWNINSKIDFRKQDLFVRKTHANSFYKTNLKDLLDTLSIHSIEFCGAQTEYCMDATIKFSHGLGYKNYMVRKATSTLNNAYMSAKETIHFYENIWSHRFLEFIED
ncbi:cysteine hydrolase family protein [Rummeliibacillus sp. SL167]|uniref:cysteine hydrolase family protein n=1 Tax=Rummeliibacillus sp. SL167 TaxID=2579792 RepID=UPI0011B36335|nr:cysteine hydrolase family protein [Rummeliibacillus sp. SL167]